ncbi:MAG: hypothetical protein HFI93_08470 [Lachnospiraceae bacterium]|nr:hypothetical protein [Lachnospiraceae bacterium]
MEPRKIGIYLKDTELAGQLVGYWKRKAPQYRFYIYEEEDAAQKGWEGGGWYRFLTDDGKNGFGMATGDRECVKFLSDSEGPEGSVYRYQSADQILAQVLGIEGEEEKAVKVQRTAAEIEDRSRLSGREADRKQMPVTGIYSPVGRCGKSRFALAIGKVWGEKENVLYLNLEVFSDLYEWLKASGGGDFSDLLYYQEQGGLTARVWEKLVRPWQGLAVIGPAVNPEDILALEFGRCEALLFSAVEAGYSRIILDVGNCHPDPAGILALCGQIYAPVTDEEVSRRKWRHFAGYLERTGRQEILNRITTIQLPRSECDYETNGLPACGEELEEFAREVLCWSN